MGWMRVKGGLVVGYRGFVVGWKRVRGGLKVGKSWVRGGLEVVEMWVNCGLESTLVVEGMNCGEKESVHGSKMVNDKVCLKLWFVQLL